MNFALIFILLIGQVYGFIFFDICRIIFCDPTYIKLNQARDMNNPLNSRITVCIIDNSLSKYYPSYRFRTSESNSYYYYFDDDDDTQWVWTEHLPVNYLPFVANCKNIMIDYNQEIQDHLKSPSYVISCSKFKNRCCELNQSNCCLTDADSKIRSKRSDDESSPKRLEFSVCSDNPMVEQNDEK